MVVMRIGPLGALYPTSTWTAPNPHGTLKEGDTPSWLYFLPVGLCFLVVLGGMAVGCVGGLVAARLTES